MKAHFSLKHFLLFSLGFILFVPIGTLSHEYGHILVANYYGFETILHFASMNYDNSAFVGDPYRHQLLISLGGPVQTILTGTISLLFLWRRDEELFYWEDWLFVYVALFWLRMPFNLIISVVSEWISPDGSYFGGDEKFISDQLGLPSALLPISLAIIALTIVVFVILKFVPLEHRKEFILSGLVGGSLGYLLWMSLLGPLVLP